jgi:hypothetical protein
VTNRISFATPRCSALLVVLLAACDTGPGPAPDAALTDMQEMRDAQPTRDPFQTKPLCASEVAYPAVSGDGICALQVPSRDGSSLDFTKLNLVLRVGGARILVFDQVADSAACDGLQAWHFDDASKPAQLVLCPQACSLASSDPDSQVQLLTGCDSQFHSAGDG